MTVIKTALASLPGSGAGAGAGAQANLIVLDNAAIGATTGWLSASANLERYGFKLLSGASVGITVDGSNDGTTSAGQVATVTLDTIGSTLISAPIKPLYPYIRFTVASGTGVAQIARGM